MTFLIIDDHPLVSDALAGVLRQLRPGCQVKQAASAAEALAVLREDSGFDLVLLDLRLPDRPGLELLQQIRRDHLGTAVLVLSGELDRATVQQALASGAAGCIPKSESRDVLASAIGLVLAGGTYVPPMILGGADVPAAPPAGANAGGVRGRSSPSDLGLTERQVDVLVLLMQGKNNKLICRALGLAEPTVKNHVSAILRALDVGSRTEAVLAVSRLGWQLPPAPTSR